MTVPDAFADKHYLKFPGLYFNFRVDGSWIFAVLGMVITLVNRFDNSDILTLQ